MGRFNFNTDEERGTPAPPEPGPLTIALDPLDLVVAEVKARPVELSDHPLARSPLPVALPAGESTIEPPSPSMAPPPRRIARIESASASKPSFVVAAGMALVTLIYCAAELFYNLALIEFVSSPNTSADAFEGLERIGKLLAAVGLSLCVSRVARGGKAVIVFGALVPCAFVLISWAFDAAIDALPKDAKRAGYYMGAYRNLVINQKIENPSLLAAQGANDLSSKLVLANIPLMSAGAVSVEDAVVSWIYGDPEANGAEEARALDSLWIAYEQVSSRVEPYYGVYAIESKINAERPYFKEKYTQAFIKRSGGIPPGLDKGAFYKAVARSTPALTQFHDAVVIPARPELNIAGLRMGDIPPFLSDVDFKALMSQNLSAAKEALSARAADVESLKDARKIISATYVPPMSLALSLVSLTLNLGLLCVSAIQLAAWRATAFRSSRAIKWGLSVVFMASASLYALSQPPALSGAAGAWQASVEQSSLFGLAWSKSINAEGALLRMSEPLLRGIHDAFIDDTPDPKLKRITIERVPHADTTDLDAQVAAFKAAPEELPLVDPSIRVNESKLDDKGYYGEIKTESNPYLTK